MAKTENVSEFNEAFAKAAKLGRAKWIEGQLEVKRVRSRLEKAKLDVEVDGGPEADEEPAVYIGRLADKILAVSHMEAELTRKREEMGRYFDSSVHT